MDWIWCCGFGVADSKVFEELGLGLGFKDTKYLDSVSNVTRTSIAAITALLQGSFGKSTYLTSFSTQVLLLYCSREILNGMQFLLCDFRLDGLDFQLSLGTFNVARQAPLRLKMDENFSALLQQIGRAHV